MAFLAADSSAFSALGGEQVGVAGVGVSPPQMCLEIAGDYVTKAAQGLNLLNVAAKAKP